MGGSHFRYWSFAPATAHVPFWAKLSLPNWAKGGWLRIARAANPKAWHIPARCGVWVRKGIDTTHFRSKSWNEFTGPNAPLIDLAITVCGNAAGEVCPVFTGAPLKAHWGLPDPADVTGSDAEVDAAFEQTWEWLEIRTRALLDLPFETMDRGELKLRLAEIGQMEGAA